MASSTSVMHESSSVVSSSNHSEGLLEGRMEELGSSLSSSRQTVESSSSTSTVQESTSSSSTSMLKQMEALMEGGMEEPGAMTKSSSVQQSSSTSSSSVVQSTSLQGEDGEKVVSTSSLQTATNSASAVKTVDGEEVERVEEGVAMR